MAKRQSKKAAEDNILVPEDILIEAEEIVHGTDVLMAEPSEEEISFEEISMSEESLMGLSIENEEQSFLPEGEDEVDLSESAAEEVASVDVEGTELDSYETAEIEETEFIEDEQLESILESILFASDRPVGLGSLKMVFKGTNIRTEKIRRALDRLAVEYAGARRGVTLEEVPGGWQIRTKVDNMDFLRRTLKTRTFKLSGPALEVLSIVAYKQPMVKSEIDEIRGVESGHLLRALMEKNLVTFAGKSDLPGRPMLYETTRKFLEIFGLRNLKELPTLSQIDELLPEGIGEEDEKKQTLSEVTDAMAQEVLQGSFSTGEEELEKIQNQLEQISVSSDFFEQEKRRQREQKDKDRAENIRDALAVGEEVPTRDMNWLKKFDEALAQGTTLVALEEAARTARFDSMKDKHERGDGVSVEVDQVSVVTDSSGDEEVAGEILFAEEAPHPEDELGDQIADIDGDDIDDGPGEGHVEV